MKRMAAVVLVLLGVALMLLGLLFLLGAAGRAHRYLIAALALSGGAALLGLGIRFFKQAEAASPEHLRAAILELARRRNGELAEADLQALLGTRSQAAAAAILARLEAEGLCQREQGAAGSFWLFRDLQPRLLVARCEFCRAELPLGQLERCPNCGGAIKTQVERRSLGKGSYGMDE